MRFESKEAMKPINQAGILPPLDVVKTHPYRFQAAMQMAVGQKKPWALKPLGALNAWARSMGYLVSSYASIISVLLTGYVDGSQHENVRYMRPGNHC